MTCSDTPELGSGNSGKCCLKNKEALPLHASTITHPQKRGGWGEGEKGTHYIYNVSKVSESNCCGS